MKLPFLGMALTVLAAGCSSATDAPDTAPVSGVVTVDGEPRGELNVVFYPEGGGRPATGTTGPDGSFVLTTNNTGDGAIIGRNKVAITGTAGSQFAESGPPMPGQAGYVEWQKEQAAKLDEKYSDPEQSGLLFTVPPDGLPDLKIEIK